MRLVATLLLLIGQVPVGETTKQAQALLKLAFESNKSGNYDDAVQYFTRSLALGPTFEGYLYRAAAYQRHYRQDLAVADLIKATELDPKNPLGWNNLAWLRATCPDERFRDAKRSVSAARKACELTNWNNAGYLDTLAAAYAEDGRFDEAIRWQSSALTQVPDASKDEFRARLSLYQRHKPYRAFVRPVVRYVAAKPVPPSPTPSRAPDSGGIDQFLETVGKVAETVEKVQKSRASMPSDPSRRSADIIIRSVSVYATKENGAAWDAGGGEPDLKVRIEQTRAFGESATTDVKQDTTFAAFNEKSIRVAEGDTIRIVVLDADAAFDDEIGSFEKHVSAQTLNERRVDWSFGRVSSLKLEFQP